MAKEEKIDSPALTFDEFVKRPPKLTVLADQPLTAKQIKKLFKDDPFNFRYKLGPIFDILRYGGKGAESDQMPTSILITGDWGTGKTTAMKWLEVLLEEWNSRKPDKVPTKDYIKVRPVWFYPWKYHDKEDVWRGLLAEVIANSIEIKNLTLKRLQYGIICFIRLPLKIISVVVDSVKIKLQSPESLWSAEIGPGALKKILTEYRKATRPYEAYRNKFEKALKLWIRNTIGKKERMVIFIDDLDRCMPEIGLQVLEALKLYLNIPNLIFVLGVDKKVIEKLVIEHYRKLGLVKEKDKEREETEAERQDRIQAERKAHQYLSKMFQTEIELAPSEKQINSFFEHHIEDISQRDARLAESDHQELFKRLILKSARRNPREVKRQLNNALIAGVGIEMIDVEQSEKQPTFDQGLQLYFIRERLREGYTLISDMINTDSGRKFFKDWSDLAIAENDVPEKDKYPGPEEDRETDVEQGEQGSGFLKKLAEKDSTYEIKKYLQLLNDLDLQELMKIPFSNKLAEFTSLTPLVITPVPSDAVGVSEGVNVVITEKRHKSKDYIIVRDAVARQLNKNPEEVGSDDYSKITELDLSGSGITDMSALKRLTNLQVLNLNSTQVSDIGALSGLKNLQRLYLMGTQVADVVLLASLTNLKQLWLYDTKISDDQVVELQKALPKLEIYRE